jgi:acetyltransferase-like isoleucine patch superfamily enzyme
MIVVQTTPELLQLLRDRRVFHKLGDGERWHLRSRLGCEPNCRIEPYTSIHQGNYLPAFMGAFSYSHSMLHSKLQMGRYVSIGEAVRLMGDRHPIEWISTSPFSYGPGPLQGLMAYYGDHDPEGRAKPRHFAQPDATIRIGNDVWIADEAMIARGVTIGDGAVVAARSLVLEDVPPYAVVAGAPAKVIRLRFPEPVVERLLRAQWWRYAPLTVESLPMEEPERFLDALEARLADDPPVFFEPPPLTFEEIVAAGARIAEVG